MDNEKNSISLLNLRDGQTGTITAINGGKALAKRLADLGMTRGSKIKVIGRTIFSGPLQIEVCGSRFVIGNGMASKIEVELA